MRSAASAATSALGSVDTTQISGPYSRSPRRGRDRRAELVQPGEQPVDEPAHVGLDRRHTDLGDELHPGDARVEGRARAACRCRSAARSRAASSRRWTSRRCPRPRTSRSASAEGVRAASSRIHMKPRPAEPSRYLTVPPVTTSAPSVRHVELERADGLVAVREQERAGRVRELGDRGHVVPVARAEGDGRAADERGPLVDLLGKPLERDAPVASGTDVDDLGAAQLLRVRDLPDRRELVLADRRCGSARRGGRARTRAR